MVGVDVLTHYKLLQMNAIIKRSTFNKTTLNLWRRFLQFSVFSILLLSTVYGKAQFYKERNIGFHLGAGVYQDIESKMPVKSYFGTNIEFGFDYIKYFKSGKFIKTGVNYTFYKSPYKNEIKYYDEYLQLPLLFSIGEMREFKHKNSLFLTFGPLVSFRTRQGVANRNDQYFDFSKSKMFSAIKFSFIGELAFYQRLAKRSHSGGLRVTVDVPKAYARFQGSTPVFDQYVTGTLFYNLNTRTNLRSARF